MAALARDERRLGEVHERLQSIRQRFPARREVGPLYRTVHDAARETGLVIVLFQPREARGQDYYTQIPIAVSARGTFHQVGRFLDRLARLPRIMTVENLKLSGPKPPETRLVAEMTLVTYVDGASARR